MKLGSLFDGSGTAPLAAAMCGIEPVWASEIEAYPIKVTSARFPGMKHLGSITEISGAEVAPVDIICGGSPCQDLSVAGKQKGLHEGERSHLFFEMYHRKCPPPWTLNPCGMGGGNRGCNARSAIKSTQPNRIIVVTAVQNWIEVQDETD